MNPVGLALRGVIRLYQVLVSPVLPSACRFTPSCSAYAMEAIGRHGPVDGAWLAAKRVCRCHPWNDGGYDPVPDAPGTECPPQSQRESDNRLAPCGAALLVSRSGGDQPLMPDRMS